VSFYSDFADHYEAVFPFREPVHRFLASHLTGDGQRILDIGCGTGHYCGQFAEAGHDVLGIDLDPEMVAVAADRYGRARFRCLDMLALDDLDPAFDLIYCVGNVAAHLPAGRLPEFLTSLRRILAPDGVWIFQVVNWDSVLDRADAGGRFRFDPRRIGDGDLVFEREYRGVGGESLRFSTRLRSGDRELFAGEVSLYPVKAGSYRRHHREAGLELVGHYGDFARSTFDPAGSGASVYVFRAR
jgi:SAM-dependent methyltransferase